MNQLIISTLNQRINNLIAGSRLLLSFAPKLLCKIKVIYLIIELSKAAGVYAVNDESFGSILL